jgi:hypothetical protein
LLLATALDEWIELFEAAGVRFDPAQVYEISRQV